MWQEANCGRLYFPKIAIPISPIVMFYIVILPCPNESWSLIFYSDVPWYASILLYCARLLRILSIWGLMSFSSEEFSSISFPPSIFTVLSDILSTYIYVHRYVVLYKWYHTAHALLFNEFYFSYYIGYISFKIYQIWH